MASQRKSPYPTLLGRIVVNVAFTVLIGTSVLALPQNPPALQISSPANGSTVNPGQNLSVNVTSPAGIAFQLISVIGPDPIGFNTQATSAPTQFSIAIPADADCRIYTLTADGLTQSGQHVTSTPIQIDVERSDVPLQISASDSGLALESLGELVHLVVLANFSDGSTIDVSRSSLVSYASSNTATVTVDTSGTVTAVAQGSASVTATYTVSGHSRQVSIPVNVSPAKVTVSPSSLTFASQSVGTSSSPQQLTLTNASPDSLSVLALTASGDFSETDNCTASSPLASSGTCTANVTFSPTIAGARTGTLSIASSANIVPVSISLSGTGTGAPPPPAIGSLSPTSGALGTSVTITGTNFGSSQGASTVTFSGTAATPTNWSTSSIVVPVPSGATTGSVVVTAGGVASNGVNFTVQGTTNGIILVQTEGIDAGTTTSSSLAFEHNNTAGNWVAVCVRGGQSSSQVFTVSDSKGNTYHQAAQIGFTSSAVTLAVYYAENIGGGPNTVTVSDTVSGPLRFAILEYTGVATANSLDVTAAATGNSASPNSGSATTTASGDLLLSAIATADAENFTAPTGVTTRVSVPTEPGTKLIAADQIQSAAGNASASSSFETSDPWGAILATFKKAHP